MGDNLFYFLLYIQAFQQFFGIRRILSCLFCQFDGFFSPEFGVFLVGCPRSEATEIFEDFKNKVSNHPIRYMQSEILITISCGIHSGLFTKQTLLTDILKKADAALYKAKNSGRNCVVAQD